MKTTAPLKTSPTNLAPVTDKQGHLVMTAAVRVLAAVQKRSPQSRPFLGSVS